MATRKIYDNNFSDTQAKKEDNDKDPDMPMTEARMGKPNPENLKVVPDFWADTTEGRIRLHEWLGDSWGILFSHPAPFTPICTTEMGSLARSYKEFESRNVKLLGVSCDNVKHLEGWTDDIKTYFKLDSFPICLLADEDRAVAFKFGLIEPTYRDNLSGIPYPCRGLFVIDPSKILRMMSLHPWSMGRSTQELLRTIDSFQLTRQYENKVCTPADWQIDRPAMIDTSVTADDINRMFRSGVITYFLPSGKEYMRTVGKLQPDFSSSKKIPDYPIGDLTKKVYENEDSE